MKWRRSLIGLLLSLPLLAQTANQGVIEGTVTDPSGAVIAGVVIRATHVGTFASFASMTDSRGSFRFLLLPPGLYEVRADHPGFTALIQRNIELGIGARLDLAIRLTVAGRTDAVVVNTEPPLIETTRTQFSTRVDARSVENLPLNGRNFLNLALLTPGITTAGGQNGNFFSFAGQISMNSLVVDGADQNGFMAPPVGTATPNRYLFSQAAIEQFQVNTSSYSSEFGRSGGGVINVVTKSGSNDWHGELFWYYRDRGLNATAYMNKLNGEPKDAFHAHQFGGAVGGPVRKDRLFFFSMYDGQRRKEQNLTVLNLPATFAFSANTTIAGFQQTALDYLRERSDPFLRTFNQNVLLAKLDWLTSPVHLLSVRWDRHRLFLGNFANIGAQQSLEHTGPVEQIADTVAASLRSVLSPALINVAGFSYVASSEPQGANSVNPEALVFEGGQQVLQVGRAARNPVDNAVRRGEWSDTLSLGRGRHALKAGVNVLLDRGRFFSALNFSGSYRFNSLEGFGRSLAGSPVPQTGDKYVQAFSGTGHPPISVHPNYMQVAGFFQDEWRLRPSLTLNLGARYDVQVMTEAALFNPSSALAAAGIDTSFVPTDGNNLAPRLGMAWSPLRNNRLVVRAGYGLFFPRLVAATAARAYFQNGLTVQTRTFSASTPNLIPAYPNTLCGPPDPSGAAPDCPAPAPGSDIIMAFAPSYQQSVVQQDSLTVEYQVRKNLAVAISYLGAKGTHLQHWQDINLPAPALAIIGIAKTSTQLTYPRYSQPRPIPDFERVLLLQTNGNSTYYGASIQVTKRFSNNFQLLASYTWGKVIDDNPTIGALNPGPGDGALLSDSLNPRADRGPGDFDQRHRLVASGLWQLTYANRLPRFARGLLAGWQVSGILSVDSGQPYSPLVNYDLNNDGNAATDRPPLLSRHSFYLPTTATFDLRLTRTIWVADRLRLQASWDAFNVFNRVNINAVRTTQFARSTSTADCGIAGVPCLVPQTQGATAFGALSGTLDPRITQLSLKLVF